MSKQLREIQARKAGLVKQARALTDIASAEGRDLTTEEVARFDALRGQIEAASAALDREVALLDEEKHMATLALHLRPSAPLRQRLPAPSPCPRAPASSASPTTEKKIRDGASPAWANTCARCARPKAPAARAA